MRTSAAAGPSKNSPDRQTKQGADAAPSSIGKSVREQALRHPAHVAADIRTVERERERGFDETRLAAAIVPLAVERDGVERLLADHPRHRVGQLDLAAGALLLA